MSGETTMSDKLKRFDVTRREALKGVGALAGAAALSGVRASPAWSQSNKKIILGTWGGDYSRLLAKNIETPILATTGWEVVKDEASDGPRRAKMIAEKRLPRGSTDVQALSAANMYEMKCESEKFESKCRRLSCVHPGVCEHLKTDHGPLIDLMKRVRKEEGIRHVHVASGVRTDLARDLADDNIRVNCVAPGVIRTRFHDDMTAERKELYLRHRIPLHRVGTPEQVAEVVALLVTNDYITGETYVIDGGLTSRIA